ncbi:hypothetical protein F5880DRAFT_1007330 [Lentinula raphanica]|nr:hypothetical protein F5880DRAFT_1007330 [Lentinula raphanica]
MLHRSNWLATVFGASLFIAAVAALPFDKSKQLSNATSTDVSMAQIAPSTVPRVLDLSKRFEAHQKKWDDQIAEQDWIHYDKENKANNLCDGYDTVGETFMRNDMTTFAKAISPELNRMDHWSQPIPGKSFGAESEEADKEYVVKIISGVEKYPFDHNLGAPCEVRALQRIGREVEAGFANLELPNIYDDPVGVIKTPKMPGEKLYPASPALESLLFSISPSQRLEFLETFKSKAEKVLYDLMRHHQRIHIAPISSYFRFTRGSSIFYFAREGMVYIEDFSYPYVLEINRLPTEAEFHIYHEKRWYFLWGSTYYHFEVPIPKMRTIPQNGDSEQSPETKEEEDVRADLSSKGKEVARGSSSKTKERTTGPTSNPGSRLARLFGKKKHGNK